MTTPLDISGKSASELDSIPKNQYVINVNSFSAYFGPFTWERQPCIVQQITYKNTEELHQEITCMRALSHPHVISIFNALNGAARTFVIHEMGTFLHITLYSAPAFDAKTSANCALQVARGMDFLHSRDVSFGSRGFPLKPNRILVTEIVNSIPKTLKVGDFRLNGRGYYPQSASDEDKFYDVWSFIVFLHELIAQTETRRWDVTVIGLMNGELSLNLKQLNDHPHFGSLLERCYRRRDQLTFTEICDFLSTLLSQLKLAPPVTTSSTPVNAKSSIHRRITQFLFSKR